MQMPTINNDANSRVHSLLTHYSLVIHYSLYSQFSIRHSTAACRSRSIYSCAPKCRKLLPPLPLINIDCGMPPEGAGQEGGGCYPCNCAAQCYFTIFGTNLLCHKSPAAAVKTVAAVAAVAVAAVAVAAVAAVAKVRGNANELANTRCNLPIRQS